MTTATTPFRFSPRPNRAAEVAWRPWGDDAFAEAREADKPVLLAISAVWCHWCHVMDETSYSDPEVIRAINERFVPVRVDNDERPDVNRRYNMGGWPTTAFLTPDGEILHGGTYVAPDQMRATLGSVADLWRDKKAELTERVTEARRREPDRAAEPSEAELSGEIVDTVGALVRGQYDPRYGGFGREPKFPQPKLVRFVLDEHRRHEYPELATMLHKTLGAMASGGMHDHVEGGFFRYATTRHWDVPHYEKMLEDNAELLALYAEAHRTFPTAGYDRVVRDVIRWMDAVLWTADLEAFAGSQDADEHYYALDAAERAKHDPPFVDRAIYTSWNALAASAYFAAHISLSDEAVGDRAHAAMSTLATRMIGPNKELLHFDRGDGPRLEDLLGDLAAYLAATLDAYETGRRPDALDEAVRRATALVDRLEDAERGGFFDAPARDEPGRLAVRDKPIEENSLAADALLRLAALTGEERWRTAALHALRSFVSDYRRWGQFAAAYANAVARALAELLVIVVAGRDTEALWSVAVACDDPARSLHRLVPGRDDERAAKLGYPLDRAAAYVCVGTVCSAPLGDPDALRAELGRARERFRREE